MNEENEVTAFDADGMFEWTGLCQIGANDIKNYPHKKYHTCDFLEDFLTIPGLKVQAMDIDTSADYNNALDFSKDFYEG